MKSSKAEDKAPDQQHSRLMLLDFECAEVRGRPLLGTLSPNVKRNIRRKMKSDVKDDEFYQEIQSASASICRGIKYCPKL
jgi:hypothetical protein